MTLIPPLIDHVQLSTYPPHVPPSSLQKSPAHTANGHTTSSAAATPARKTFPWENVPPWSPLYHKLQLHSTTSLHNQTVDTSHAGSDSRGATEPESHRIKSEFRVQLSEISSEIPETPGTNQSSPLVRDNPSSMEMDNLQSTDQTELSPASTIPARLTSQPLDRPSRPSP